MLKERIIEALDKNYLLFTPISLMEETDLPSLPLRFNLVGLILECSGVHLQTTDAGVRLPMSTPPVERKWIEFERMVATFPTGAVEYEISALARQLWSEQYGEEEARALPFYDAKLNIPGTSWWDDLSEVNALDIRYYLRGLGTPHLNLHVELAEV